MKNLKKWILIVLLMAIGHSTLQAQEIDKSVFSLLNLDYKGLEPVKQALAEGREAVAAQKLLEYYQNRKGIVDPSIDLKNIRISKDEQLWADEALEHKLISMVAFQPSFFYGKDIDWRFWPVKDHELRWQLHRFKWFIPMGKAFRVSGDEKYAKEWVFQLQDWIKKNPIIEGKKSIAGVPVTEADLENETFAWRPLETSGRLVTYGACLEYFKTSKYFTPEFLCTFLENVERHASYTNRHYSEIGNHLLFEAQYIFYAGVFFPEFKDAPLWRKAGIDILTKQMNVQVYPDGMQFELDPGYHGGAIITFLHSLTLADLNGYRSEFGEGYVTTVKKMIEGYYNLLLPDGTIPQFSDVRTTRKVGTLSLFQKWANIFPEDQQIRYFATDGKEGKAPGYTSNAFKNSGFYMMRTGWDEKSTVMVLKAGPPAFWHNQPDNGTFELYHNGRNFFPDAGSYVYGGDAEVLRKREAFRLTSAHNTLTLNDSTIKKTDSKCLLWKTDKMQDVLVVENPSYPGLNHRRSVFFVDKKFYVIVDEAVGNATGRVGVHYHFCEGELLLDPKSNQACTNFSDRNNMFVKVFSTEKSHMNEQESWISYVYDVKYPRKAFVVNSEKEAAQPVRFITVLMPVSDVNSVPAINATFDAKSFNEKSLGITVKIGEKNYKLGYTL